MVRLLLINLLLSSSLHAMELPRESIRMDRIGEIGLSYDGDEFTVHNGDSHTRVQRADIDEAFRGRSCQEIAAFAAVGKFKVSKFQDGGYAVRAHGDIKGGGPILGGIFYFLTKAVIHGAIAVGISKIGHQLTDGNGVASGPSAAVISLATEGVSDAVPGAAIVADVLENANNGEFIDPAMEKLAFVATVHHVGVGAGAAGAEVAAGLGPIEMAAMAAYTAGNAIPGPF